MPQPIDYATFLANAQPADVRALAYLLAGEPIRTTDPVEADAFEAQGVRLFDAGLVSRVRRSLEEGVNDTVVHVFDALLKPAAVNYVAQAALERVQAAQAP